MDTATTADTLATLHEAITRAARRGAGYPWIAGVLAACLAAEATTTAETRILAVETLSRAPVRPDRPQAE